jgi:hypothetical protein
MPDTRDLDRINDTKALTPLLLMALIIVIGIFVGIYIGHA